MKSTGGLTRELKEFRARMKHLADDSKKKEQRCIVEKEDSLEVPFHEGKTSSYQLVLDILDEMVGKKPVVALNGVEEAYYSLLVDYKRMHGAVSALEAIIKEMQSFFGLPEEKEMEEAQTRKRVPGR